MQPSTFRVLRATASSVALLLALTTPCLLEAQTGSIEGTVTDSGSGEPLAGALIRAHGPTPGLGWWGAVDLTDENGHYRIEHLHPGPYRVSAGRIGYLPQRVEVDVVAGETAVVDFLLEPIGFGTVTGTVTDADTGDPIAGARVLLRRDGNVFDGVIDGWVRHTETGDDGTYTFEHVVSGDYKATAFRFGYHPGGPKLVTVIAEETTVADFALDPFAFGSVTGTVTDADTGSPIAGARILLHRQGDWIGGLDHWWWRHAVTGDDGSYAINDVLAGNYRATAFRPGYQPSEPVRVAVEDGMTTVVDFALAPIALGSLEGHVTDAGTHEPVEGALVFARRLSPAGFLALGHFGVTRTDAEGFYRFEKLEVGAWRVFVGATGYHFQIGEASVFEGETSVLDLALDPL